jgi:predicted aldo/keto reductase-like oxidoreductase
MQHRTLGSSGARVPVLGFGLMRLPTVGGRRDTKRRCAIDVAQSTQLVHRAFDSGVNYFDTAYVYHQGWSEPVCGRILGELPRERLLLATKLPVWLVKQPADFERFLRTQLRRLRTPYLDFCLLHALNRRTWPAVKELGALDFLERAKRQGRIRHIAFSFHDRLPLFRQIVDAHDWSFCQVQYNIVDTREQAGTAGVRYAAKKGLGVVVMEPLRGGALADARAPGIRRIWQQSRLRRKPAELALRWVWNQPEVSMLLSGMSSLEQLEQNIAWASRARVGCLTAAEKTMVARLQRAYRSLCTIPCTACDYCQPCPQGIRISAAFGLYNDWQMFPDHGDTRLQWRGLFPEGKRPSDCTECGACETKCPQHIPIRARLKHVAALLEPACN